MFLLVGDLRPKRDRGISNSPKKQVQKCHTPYRRLKSIQKKDKGNPYCGKQDVRRGVHPPSHEAYLLPPAGSPFPPLPSRLLPFLSPSLMSPLAFPFLRLPFLSFPSLPSPNSGYGVWGAVAPPAGPGGTRLPNTFWCNSQPKIC